MKHFPMMAALMASATLTNAQPVLTFPSNVPTLGTSHTIHASVYRSPGSAGADQNWDLSELTSDSITLVQYVAPGTTVNGALFPNSTVAQTGDDVNLYYRGASDGLYLMGTHADEVLIIYSDEAKHLPFPCAYQTSWTDQSAAEFEIQGFTDHRSGSITGTADGYGTLTLPNGTYDNVLRIHLLEELVDSTEFFTFQTVNERYIFFSAAYSYPLALVNTTLLSIFGQTDTIRSAQWMEDPGTAVPRVERDSDQLDLFPVPASDILHFTWPEIMNGQPVVSITDAQGRTVRNLPGFRMQGRSGQLDLRGLPPGIYQFAAIDEQGKRAVRKFVIQ